MPSILDHPLLSRRYFWPRPDAVPDAAAFPVATRDGVDLRCARVGDGPDWVIHFHGNGEVAEDWRPILPPLFASAGFSTLLVEYRGYGGSGGSPSLAAMAPDGEDALRALGPARTVVAFGRSIGSLYAAELAARAPLAGVILDSGIHDLTERILVRVTPAELGTDDAGLRRAVAATFDQGAKLARHRGRALLLHAEDDDLVGIGHARRNAAAAARPAVVTFREGGHNGLHLRNRAAYDAAVVDFLRAVAAA